MTDFSFQLYSARNFPLGEALALLSRLGYAQVEGYGGLYGDAARLRALLDRHGLTMPTGHFSIELLEDSDRALKLAEILGVSTLFCPAVPRELWDQPEDGWKRLAERLARLGETYAGAGYGLGWHNHHFEFRPTASGALPMDLILSGAPEIGWEMDVAWAVRGGQDPLGWIDRYADRITAVHVKDIAPEGEAEDEDGWADVGHGVLDWTGIMAALREKTRADVFVMEHDNPSDLDRFASRSIAAARALGVA